MSCWPFNKEKRPKDVDYATREELRALELRLTALILAVHEGDKERITKVVADLKLHSDTLASAVKQSQQ